MFTGIVEELGEVVALEQQGGAARLVVKGPKVAADAADGDSICVDGVCLTVTSTSAGAFTADVMGETLRRSGIGGLVPGSLVNLERSLRASDRLGGHLVQGHVDGTGRILSRTPAQHWEVVRIGLPGRLARYVTEKGSVAVDGVSLTVSAAGGTGEPRGTAQPGGDAGDPGGDTGEPGGGTAQTGGEPGEGRPEGPWFEVSLIPATLRLTTLGRKQPGDLVNLEADVVAKYVEKLLRWRQR